MNVGRAMLCLLATPLVCAALATSIRAQGFEGPGGPVGGFGDG